MSLPRSFEGNHRSKAVLFFVAAAIVSLYRFTRDEDDLIFPSFFLNLCALLSFCFGVYYYFKVTQASSDPRPPEFGPNFRHDSSFAKRPGFGSGNFEDPRDRSKLLDASRPSIYSSRPLIYDSYTEQNADEFLKYHQKKYFQQNTQANSQNAQNLFKQPKAGSKFDPKATHAPVDYSTHEAGIFVERDTNEKENYSSLPPLFTDLPYNREPRASNPFSSQGRRLFSYQSFEDNSRKGTVGRNRSDSYTLNRHPSNDYRSAQHASLSPMRVDHSARNNPLQTANKRSVINKNTIAIKGRRQLPPESVSRYSNYDAQNIGQTNRGQYKTACDSIEKIGGTVELFMKSLEGLQTWISRNLIPEYLEDNRVAFDSPRKTSPASAAACTSSTKRSSKKT